MWTDVLWLDACHRQRFRKSMTWTFMHSWQHYTAKAQLFLYIAHRISPGIFIWFFCNPSHMEVMRALILLFFWPSAFLDLCCLDTVSHSIIPDKVPGTQLDKCIVQWVKSCSQAGHKVLLYREWHQAGSHAQVLLGKAPSSAQFSSISS